MGDDFATLTLTRRTWTLVFVSQLHYLYSLLLDRDQEEPGSNIWNAHNQAIREAVQTFMPVLKVACENEPELDSEWFAFKLAAGIFNSEVLEDNASKIVHIYRWCLMLIL